MNVARKHVLEISYDDMATLKANLGVGQKAFENDDGKGAFRHDSGANDFYVYPREGGDATFANVIVDNLNLTDTDHYDKMAYIDASGNIIGSDITPAGESQLELSTRVDGWLKKQWSILGRSETNFLTTFGDYSVDLSSSISDTDIDYNVGAGNNNAFISGQNNLTRGMYSLISGYGNIAAGNVDATPGVIEGNQGTTISGVKNQSGTYHSNISVTNGLINNKWRIANNISGHLNICNGSFSSVSGIQNMINIVYPSDTHTLNVIDDVALKSYYRHLTGAMASVLQAYIDNSGADLSNQAENSSYGNWSLVSGENNIVNGIRCTVLGLYNSVHQTSQDSLINGEWNFVEGKYCFVTGQGNTILNDEYDGNYNNVMGISNTVTGNDNTVLGSDHAVIGRHCTVIGQDNQQSGVGYCNLIMGNQNAAVDSNDIFIGGIMNSISGASRGFVYGDGNNVKGHNNFVFGNSNQAGLDTDHQTVCASIFGVSNIVNGGSGLTTGLGNTVRADMTFVSGEMNLLGTFRGGFNSSVLGSQNYAVSSFSHIQGLANVVGHAEKDLINFPSGDAYDGSYIYDGTTPDGNRCYANPLAGTWIVRNLDDDSWVIHTAKENPNSFGLYYNSTLEESGIYIETTGGVIQVLAEFSDIKAECARAYGHSNMAVSFASSAEGIGCVSGTLSPDLVSDAYYDPCLKIGYQSNGLIDIIDVTTLESASLTVNLPDKYKTYGLASKASGIRSMSLGTASHAFGVGAIANNLGSMAIGTFNKIITDSLFEVGSGTSGSEFNALTVMKSGEISQSNTKSVGSLNETIYFRIDKTVLLNSTVILETFVDGEFYPRIYISYDYLIDIDDEALNSCHRLRAGKLMIIADATNQQIDVTEIETDDLNGDTSFVTFSAAYNVGNDIEIKATNADLGLNAVISLRKSTMF